MIRYALEISIIALKSHLWFCTFKFALLLLVICNSERSLVLDFVTSITFFCFFGCTVPLRNRMFFPAHFKDGQVAFLSVYQLNREPVAHKMTGNLSLYLFLNKYRLSFNSCGCMFAYQQERESRKTLKPLYRTRSPCKQHRVNSVRLECRVQIYSRTVRLIKAILPHVQANKSAVLIMIISSNILSDSCTKKWRNWIAWCHSLTRSSVKQRS